MKRDINMRIDTACFTGHRIIGKELLPKLKSQLRVTIEKLIENGVIYYGCGGALGFDQLAGNVVIEMKKEYPQIRLIMILPCKEQDKPWNESEKNEYRSLLSLSDKNVYLQELYDNNCMLKRNRYMVDESGICIAYLTKDRSGTSYTVKYAKDKNRKIINIAETL